MTGSQKRKGGSHELNQGASKRSKGGNKKQWQTTAGLAKSTAPVRGGSILPGDSGIWVTCMRGKEGKATIELKDLLPHYASLIYNLKSDKDNATDDDTTEAEDKVDDIEASFKAELEELGSTKKDENGQVATQQFQPVFLDVPCVLFFKTIAPVDPTEFVEKMCMDHAKNAKLGVASKSRFANRLTPSSLIGKASENGLKEVATKVLGRVFRLAGEGGVEGSEHAKVYSYAIRPTIRNHSALERGKVIQMVADLVHKDHSVNLGNPDKVILVEIYQNICGVSVVDGPSFEELKRYNLHEIYQEVAKKNADEGKVKEDDTSV